MRLFITFLMILVTFGYCLGQELEFPTNFKFPKINKNGKKIQDFVPKNWKILHKTFGDLNGDQKDDSILVLRATFAKFIHKNIGFSDEGFDTNPQMLLILFNNGKGYKLIEQNNTFIIGRESQSDGEPFQKFMIKDGVLHLDFEHWQSAGSWYTSETTYKFKFIKRSFVLIGLDKSESMRNAGEVTTRSFNFITRKLKTSFSDYEGKITQMTKWTNIQTSKLKTFKTYKAPYTWKIDKDDYL